MVIATYLHPAYRIRPDEVAAVRSFDSQVCRIAEIATEPHFEISIRKTEVPVGWYLPEDLFIRTGIGGEAVHDDGSGCAGGFVRLPVDAWRSMCACHWAACRVGTIGSLQAPHEVPPSASGDIVRSNSREVTTSGLKN